MNRCENGDWARRGMCSAPSNFGGPPCAPPEKCPLPPGAYAAFIVARRRQAMPDDMVSIITFSTNVNIVAEKQPIAY
eukprot:gene21906-32055_t